MKNIKFFFLLLIFFGIFLTCENPEEPDTTPPVVSIQSPISGAKVSEIVKIVVSASDNKGIEKVEFYIDDSLYYSDFQEPYEYYWNTCLNDDNSEHIVKVKAYDESENFTLSQPILLIVDNSKSYPSLINIVSVTYTFDEMTVTWEKSHDSDFKEYKLLYSQQEYGQKDTLITYTDKSIISYVITEFDPTHENWFWILVSDTLGLSTVGNGMSNNIELPPTLVQINSIIYNENENSFDISWDKNNDNDFAKYIISESFSEDMSEKNEIFVTNDRNINKYSVISVNNDEYRYYQIAIKDIWGLESIGRIMTGSPYPKIAFSSGRDSYGEIYIMDINGKAQINLTNCNGDDSRPLFSHNGSKIVFRSERDGNREIYIMNSDGTNQLNLSNSSYLDYNPCFSPNDSKIVFKSFRDGNSEIYIMNSDGSNQVNLSNYHGYDGTPYFFNDGLRILFYRNFQNGSIYSVNNDGTNLTNLITNSGSGRFSPDGSKIIYGYKGHESGLYIMNSDGSNKKRISDNCGDPKISPDNSKIVLTIYISDGIRDIGIMNIDGSNLTNLTNNSYYDHLPEFSPDGSKIVFTSSRDGNSEIYIMNSDGSNQINLSNSPGNDGFPQFQPRQ